ncbi:MAG: hypothetical protein OQL09_06700 [Gammaproteobacteria bacterium]|nr:hypothetical protein [Gammaproteobacteria bacterium]
MDNSVAAMNEKTGNFPSIEEYTEPDCDQFCEILHGKYSFINLDVSDRRKNIDNRTLVRLFLLLRGVKDESFKLLVEPYDNGFYKRADGKSSAFGVFKVARVQKILRFKKDIVSIRHDWDYYTGVDQKIADKRYLKLQIEVGYQKWRAKFEYRLLRMFGQIAWSVHKKKRDQIPEYGTKAYIRKLPLFG